MSIKTIIGAVGTALYSFYTLRTNNHTATSLGVNKDNQKKAGCAIAGTATLAVTTTAVDVHLENETNRRLEENYGITVSYIDSLTEEQLAELCELTDGKIAELEAEDSMAQNEAPKRNEKTM